jgi:hypothetical protein
VKKSGMNSIGIISFITIFSVINGLFDLYIKYKPVAYALSAVCEVTNAIRIYAGSDVLPFKFKLILSAFSLGFGGACVGLQSSVFTAEAGLGMKRYYLTKVLLGVLAASIFSILYRI